MKKAIILILIIGLSIFFYNEFNTNKGTRFIKGHNTKEKVLINKEYLNVTYIKGNKLDEDISFGNIINKEIEIENKNSQDISFRINIDKLETNIKNISTTVYLFQNKTYHKINEGMIGETIAYNLGIKAKDRIKLKVVFKALEENFVSNIKGELKIATNLSAKGIFLKDMEAINDKIQTKIKAINGINIPGYYILDVQELAYDGFKGFIFINATDISMISYKYYVFNNDFMVRDYYHQLNQKKVLPIDKNYINNLNYNNVCLENTKNQCINFNTLKYHEAGGKEKFYDDSKQIINKLKKEFKKTTKRVYIIDVKNEVDKNININGYILIDNTKNVPEYFIYLNNGYFMISGYNLTKYGDYSLTSSTIRSYNQSAFALSAKDMPTVCHFSGYQECFNSNDQKV